MPRQKLKKRQLLAKVSEPHTFITLIAHFLDFLVVTIHTILYQRGVYPKEAFSPCRRYNYPLRWCRVPEVNDWIAKTINAIEIEMKKGNVESISLVITSIFGDPLERFVIDMSKFPFASRTNWYAPFSTSDPQHKQYLRQLGVGQANMDQQFRAVMARLQFCHRELDPLPPDVSWNIAIGVNKDVGPPGPITNKRSPWIPIDPRLQYEPGDQDTPERIGQDVGGARMVPIRLVEAGEMAFEVWAEETTHKIDALDQLQFPQEYLPEGDLERDRMDMDDPEHLPGFHMAPAVEYGPHRPVSKGKERARDDDDDGLFPGYSPRARGERLTPSIRDEEEDDGEEQEDHERHQADSDEDDDEGDEEESDDSGSDSNEASAGENATTKPSTSPLPNKGKYATVEDDFSDSSPDDLFGS